MKKLSAGLLVGIVAVVLVLWWVGGKVERGELGDALYVASSTAQKTVTLDSDRDGLKDWEELLWKTDKTNADTDGDGTSHGEELALGRDPRKKGSGDKLSGPEDLVRAAVHTSGSDAEGVIFPSAEDLKPGLVYTAFDLHTVDSKDPSFIKYYGISLRDTLKPLGSSSFGQAASNTVAALSKKDSTAIERIRAEEALLLSITKNLLVLDVPESASAIHLNLLNTLTEMAELAYTMEHVEREPAFALASAEAYEKKKPELLAVLGNVNAYFKEMRIAFDAKNTVNISL